MSCHILKANSGFVTERIVGVNVSRCSGQVYNLQTKEHWFIASGIITHNCTTIPWLGSGVGKQPWSAEESFAKLQPKDQIRVLGPARYRLWKDGKIGLADLPVKVKSKTWGDHYRPKTIVELMKEGKITAAEARAARWPPKS